MKMDKRQRDLLLKLLFSDSSLSSLRLPESLDKDDRLLFFQTCDMAECLAGPGYNAERLSIPYVPQVTGTNERL